MVMRAADNRVTIDVDGTVYDEDRFMAGDFTIDQFFAGDTTKDTLAGIQIKAFDMPAAAGRRSTTRPRPRT